MNPELRPDDLTAAGVRLDVTGQVATVSLCRPERRNAQTPALWRALAGIGRDLPDSVRVVVLRAEGPSFSAGLDRRLLTGEDVDGEPGLAGLAHLEDEALDAAIAGFQEAFSWWSRPGLVSVAAVAGHAVGAGFQLALACDLRVLADDAQLAMRETSLGLVPDLGGTKPLVEAVGYSRALEICLTGRWVGAQEAGDLGLATLVVPREQLDGTVDDLVAALTVPPAGAVAETKSLLAGAYGRDAAGQRRAERAAQARRLRALVGLG
ncbi:MAG: enoyl-CoA hydratase/isomerase family protein [Actinomycetes bacterium]